MGSPEETQAAGQRGIRTIDLSEKKAEYEVFARIDLMGPDVMVTLWGGVAHVGALGMAVPRPSLKDRNVISSTSSVFTFPGHKEDVTVKALSERLSAALNRKVIVIAGIHWDALGAEGIRSITEVCEAIGTRILLEVEKA